MGSTIHRSGLSAQWHDAIAETLDPLARDHPGMATSALCDHVYCQLSHHTLLRVARAKAPDARHLDAAPAEISGRTSARNSRGAGMASRWMGTLGRARRFVPRAGRMFGLHGMTSWGGPPGLAGLRVDADD